MSIRFVALDTEVARALQRGGVDANGHEPEHHVSSGGMMPCRHCLSDIKAGERYLILAFRPFPAAQPYAEMGPIFLHALDCRRHAESTDTPPMFLSRQAYLIRGYGIDDRIVYGSGRMVAPAAMAAAARDAFTDPRIHYLHVRSATNNCYQCRIDRV
jgi:hypothetical protein